MKIYEGNIGKIYVSRLNYGSDLLDSIKTLAKEKSIKAGIFFLIGAVSQAKFGYYDQKNKRYKVLEVNEPMEIVSCIGNVSWINNNIVIHAHIIFAKENGESLGGHLIEGTKVFAGELFMVEIEGVKLVRGYDELTGLNQIL